MLPDDQRETPPLDYVPVSRGPGPDRRGRRGGLADLVALLVFFMSVGVAVAVFLWATQARAHDAMPTASKPQGWSYPFSCCSGYDCREVAETAISERPEGYVINGTGEVVGYQDTRLKDSPDGEFHWCSVAGADDGRTICLFVPPRGF